MYLTSFVSVLVGRGSNAWAATVHGAIAIMALVVATGHRDDYIDGGHAQLLCSRVVEPAGEEERRMFLAMEYTEEGCPSLDILMLLFVIEAVTAIAHVWFAVSRNYAVHMGTERADALVDSDDDVGGGGASTLPGDQVPFLNDARWMLEFPITAPGVMVVTLVYAGQRDADVLALAALALAGMALMGNAIERPPPRTQGGRSIWKLRHRVATWAAAACVFVGFLVTILNSWARITTASDAGTIPDLPSFVPYIVKAEIAALCLFPAISISRSFLSRRATEAAWVFASFASKVPLALVILFAQRK